MINPTLTEDDIFIQRFGDQIEIVITKTLTKEKAEQLKQQILTALEQYPKLREKADKWDELEPHIRNSSHFVVSADYKHRLESYYTENQKLKQLKQRIEDRIKELQEFPKSQYSSVNQVKHAYSVESELQQLLKDDTK